MTQLGWLPTTDPRKMADNERYDLRLLRLAAPPMGSVEVKCDYNPDWIDEYDQGPIGSCVGYSCSWMKSYHDKQLFNGYWLYKQAQKVGGGSQDDQAGAYLWAAGDVMRLKGHALYKQTTPDLQWKIESYYWAKTVDDIRTAFAFPSPRPVVFGIPWFAEFDSPRLIGNDYWIGTRANWGSLRGGHAIHNYWLSDSKTYSSGPQGAGRLVNTWNKAYPPVWISYRAIEKLFTYSAECMICLDYKPAPPPPPPPPEDSTLKVNELEIETPDGKIVHLKGTLERVK